MAELTKEQVKKNLEEKLAKEASKIQKTQEDAMPEAERKALEAKKAEDAKKAEETRIASEAQAKKDAELLLKKDEEIKDEAEKKRKTELLEAKRKEEESKQSPEEKIKKIKEETQKRIDELSNQLKETKDKSSKEADSLRKELAELRKEKMEKVEDLVSIVEKEESEKHKKFLEEDKTLPKEKRREMTDEELDDWLLEDQKSAIAWIQRRELRREIDKRQNLVTKQKEGISRKLFEKQAQSYNRVISKYPELDVKKRKDELKAQGKTEDEADAIVRGENSKYDAFVKVLEENPDLKLNPDAPEKMAEEMEKGLVKKTDTGEKTEIDKLREKVEALEAEIAKRDSTDEGISSTHSRDKNSEEKLSETENMIAETMRKNKATQEMIDSAIKDYRAKKKK
ncbi:MAG: hypothetical protein PHY56_00855 [Candidatus Omnitrophica bacterium]|nr:hypothetical protein [Candidatus Omnitrophota bacterium]